MCPQRVEIGGDIDLNNYINKCEIAAMTRARRERDTWGCENPGTEMALVLRPEGYLEFTGQRRRGAFCRRSILWKHLRMGRSLAGMGG